MITIFNQFNLLGSTTIKQAVRTARAVLNEEDNQRLSDMAIRMYLNMAKMEMAETISTTNNPMYDYLFYAEPNTDTDIATFDLSQKGTTNRVKTFVIDLATTLTMIVPATFFGNTTIRPMDYLLSIKAVSVLGIGEAQKVPHARLVSIASDTSETWDRSVLWSLVDNKIFLYIGGKAIDFKKETEEGVPDPEKHLLQILTVRYPLKDTLVLPELSVMYDNIGQGYTVDVPEQAMRLLITMVQKMCLESLGKQPVLQMEQVIQQLWQGINGMNQQSKQINR